MKKKSKPKVCVWKYKSEAGMKVWSSSCNFTRKIFGHIVRDYYWKFCPYCSKRIEEVLKNEKEDDL